MVCDPRDVKILAEFDAVYEALLPSVTTDPGGKTAKRQRDRCNRLKLDCFAAIGEGWMTEYVRI